MKIHVLAIWALSTASKVKFALVLWCTRKTQSPHIRSTDNELTTIEFEAVWDRKRGLIRKNKTDRVKNILYYMVMVWHIFVCVCYFAQHSWAKRNILNPSIETARFFSSSARSLCCWWSKICLGAVQKSHFMLVEYSAHDSKLSIVRLEKERAVGGSLVKQEDGVRKNYPFLPPLVQKPRWWLQEITTNTWRNTDLEGFKGFDYKAYAWFREFELKTGSRCHWIERESCKKARTFKFFEEMQSDRSSS